MPLLGQGPGPPSSHPVTASDRGQRSPLVLTSHLTAQGSHTFMGYATCTHVPTTNTCLGCPLALLSPLSPTRGCSGGSSAVGPYRRADVEPSLPTPSGLASALQMQRA